MKFYFSFGQDHVHGFDGKVFNKDCIVEITAVDSDMAREIMFDNFGRRWSNEYDELPDMTFFPRGIIKL